MALVPEIETQNYVWQYDWRNSVARFVRKADGAISVPVVGPEADETYDMIQRVRSRVAADPAKYGNRTFEDILECDAAEQTYQPSH